MWWNKKQKINTEILSGGKYKVVFHCAKGMHSIRLGNRDELLEYLKKINERGFFEYEFGRFIPISQIENISTETIP